MDIHYKCNRCNANKGCCSCNCGYYCCPPGPQGPQGANGKSAYELAVEKGYTGTEEQWLNNLTGATGPAGATGATGMAGAVGPAGATGPIGPTGKAATISVEASSRVPFDDMPYVVNVGTPQAAVLKFGIPAGAPGATGKQGANGKSAYEIAVEKGYTGTEEQWLNNLKGATGPTGATGKQGINGKSAYEIAVEKGYTGTEEQWLNNLKGATGPTGATGEQGANGKSAYEIAVEKGYTGTEEQWLNNLKGATGPTGAAGATGATGIAGATGATGPAFSSSYGVVLKSAGTVTLASNDVVPFDFTGNMKGMTLSNGGLKSIALGRYYIHFHVAVDGNQTGFFSITVDGASKREGIIQFSTPPEGATVSGGVIFTLSPGEVVAVSNYSNKPINIGSTASWGLGSLSVFRID